MAYKINNYELVSTDTVSDKVTKYTFNYEFIETESNDKFAGTQEVNVLSFITVDNATAAFLGYINELGNVLNAQLNSNLPIVGIVAPEVEEETESATTLSTEESTTIETPVVEEVVAADVTIGSFTDTPTETVEEIVSSDSITTEETTTTTTESTTDSSTTTDSTDTTSTDTTDTTESNG